MSQSINFSNLILNYSKNTECFYLNKENIEIAILGLCIDSYGEIERNSIADFVLKSIKNNSFPDTIPVFDRLAGKYVIIFSDSNDLYTINDATASMGIYYHRSKNCIASCEMFISDYYGLQISKENKSIKDASTGNNQPFPNNLTFYDDISVLLPNHFFVISQNKDFRYFPTEVIKEESTSFDKIINRTIYLVDNIVKEYQKYYTVTCPLTSGTDSRLVYAFLQRNIKDLECYTFWHKNFSENTGDIYIPKQITNQFFNEYIQIPDLKAPEDWYKYIENNIVLLPDQNTIDLAYTYGNTFHEHALINGDIIDQIGKSFLGQNLNEIFATKYFFRCKIHNFSDSALKEIEKWISSVASNIFPTSLYDLFAWENSLGRWASQTNLIYSALNITMLNIFNCRELILLWLEVPRSKRSKREIHMSILKNIMPDLLNYPFNPGSKVRWIIDCQVAFLLATYVKYFRDKLIYFFTKK